MCNQKTYHSVLEPKFENVCRNQRNRFAFILCKQWLLANWFVYNVSMAVAFCTGHQIRNWLHEIVIFSWENVLKNFRNSLQKRARFWKIKIFLTIFLTKFLPTKFSLSKFSLQNIFTEFFCKIFLSNFFCKIFSPIFSYNIFLPNFTFTRKILMPKWTNLQNRWKNIPVNKIFQKNHKIS